MKKIFLIDGMYIAYRSFYAISHLSDSKGRPTNAIYGFIKTLKKMIDVDKPEYICVTFDVAAPTFRHLEFKGYKAQRKPMPEDMVPQIPLIKEAIAAMGIEMLTKEGFEADDLMATIAKNVTENNDDIQAIIVSKDKDLMQMVNDKIHMYDFKSETHTIGPEGVLEKQGVKPSEIIDMLSLCGDSADNIPGVEGVGPKTAAKLINQHKTIDGIYQNIDDMKKSKLKERLIKHREEVYLNRNIIKIKDDVELDFKLEDTAVKPFGHDIAVFLHEYELKSLLRDFAIEMPKQKIEVTFNTLKPTEDMPQEIKEAKELYIHVCEKEVALFDGKKIYFTEDISANDNLREFLKTTDCVFNGYDIKKAVVALNENGCRLKNIGFDVFIAAYLINPSGKEHALKDVVFNFLDIDFEFKEQEQIPFAVYSVYFSANLKDVLVKELKEKELFKLYQEVERPIIEILANMQIKGIKADKEILQKLNVELDLEIEQLKADIYKEANQEFNINSTKEMGRILFEELKLPVQKKTKTGYSTDNEVLTKLASFHSLPEKVLLYRRNTKLKNTYIDPLPLCIKEDTGRICAEFNQAVTATGRLSSSNPNLQNIPIKTEIGRKIRDAFVPKNGNFVFLGADYSQIELRILAHLSNDENLLKAFNNNEDIHTFTASLIFGVDLDEVDYEMRSKAKTINFGILYGMSTYGLAKDLNIPFYEAKHFIETYFKRYPQVAEYMDLVVKEAKEKHFVKTMLNRRRYLPEINSSNLSTRQFAERTAINTVIQGTAADLIKVAMVKIGDIIKEKNYKADFVLQIHDELVFEVPKTEIMLFEEEVRRFMEGAFKLNVPLTVNINIGNHWGEI